MYLTFTEGWFEVDGRRIYKQQFFKKEERTYLHPFTK
jgi:hypothetical protein